MGTEPEVGRGVGAPRPPLLGDAFRLEGGNGLPGGLQKGVQQGWAGAGEGVAFAEAQGEILRDVRADAGDRGGRPGQGVQTVTAAEACGVPGRRLCEGADGSYLR